MYIFMPPTSEEVEGAYWFGVVRAVCLCSLSVQSVQSVMYKLRLALGQEPLELGS